MESCGTLCAKHRLLFFTSPPQKNAGENWILNTSVCKILTLVNFSELKLAHSRLFCHPIMLKVVSRLFVIFTGK